MESLVVKMPFGVFGLVMALVGATVVHEAGHLLAAGLLRIPVRRISVGLGPLVCRRHLGNGQELVLRALPVGVTLGVPARTIEQGRCSRPIAHDLFLALSGPIASMLLFVALATAAGLVQSSPQALAWFQATAVLSMFLGFSNLLPWPGLDGGHALILCVTGAGFRLSPQREQLLHRLGFRLAAGACVAAAVGRVVGAL